DSTMAGLLQPIPALTTIQLCFQFFGEGQQIMHIIDRVFRHARRQRSLCPIRLLRTFQESESKITFHQRSEAKFANAKETSCDQCVEDSFRCEIQAATQHSESVITFRVNAIRSATIQRWFWSHSDYQSTFPSLREVEVLPSFCAASAHVPIHRDDTKAPRAGSLRASDGLPDIAVSPGGHDQD